MSSERRDRIRELLVEELHEAGELSVGAVVTTWMALVRVHSFDDTSVTPEEGSVATVTCDPRPPMETQLGLLEFRRAEMQAALTAAWLKAWEE